MIRIYADSTNDLTPALWEKHNIRVIPLYVNMGDETYMDWRNITPDKLYAWSNAHNTIPVTAAFSVGDAESALKEAADAGDDVIRKYYEDLEPLLKNADPDNVFISHTGRLPQEIIDEAADRVRSLGAFKNIHVTRTGSVVTIHCGPGTLGVFYMASNANAGW